MFGRHLRVLALVCGAAALVVLYGVALFLSIQSTRAAVTDLRQVTEGIGPLSLAQVETFTKLDEQFGRVNRTSTLTLRLMTPLRPLSWVPLLGHPVRSGIHDLEMARLAASAGEDLAVAFKQALITSAASGGARDTAAADSLGRSLAQLNDAQAKLRKLREQAAAGGLKDLPAAYASAFSDFVPLSEAVVFLSRTQPETMGKIIVLAGDVQTVSAKVAEPIDVLEDPGSLRDALMALQSQSGQIIHELDQGIGAANATDLKGVGDTLTGIRQDMQTLNLVATGLGSLVDVGQALTSQGMFSDQFARTARDNLPKARDSLRLARAQMQKGSGSTLAIANRPAPAVQTGLSFNVMADQIDSAIKLIDFLWSFLGFDHEKTYLLLGQNQQEIRATGGFIGVVVQLTVDQGKMTGMRYLDSTGVDPEPLATDPPAPPGLYWYLWMDRMLFRDSNWNPDYPSSAATIAAQWKTTQGVQVDGVVTGSKRLMVDLVDMFGDIHVPGVPGVLTPEQAQYYTDENTDYPCTKGRADNRGKRCFDQDLFNALWTRLQSGVSSEESVQLVTLLRRDLDRKNILIHLFDPQAAEMVWEQEWNGAVTRTDGDYLMVVDSSLPGHSSPVVTRHIEYRVGLQPQGPVTAELRVNYRNTAPPSSAPCRQAEWKELTCYWNYVRILLPGDASVVAPPVLLHEGAEKLAWGYADLETMTVAKADEPGLRGLTEAGAFLVVEPSSRLSLPLEYQLPEGIVKHVAQDTWEYRLLVQKQPGVDGDTVDVDVDLPLGAELVRSTPAPSSHEGPNVHYTFALTRDQEIAVTFGTR